MTLNAPSLRFGLKESVIEKLNAIFSRHSSIKKVILYGSRAKGHFQPGSDIDLTIQGNTVSYPELLEIENELDDLLLPYKIDLSLFHQIDNKDLIDHIQHIGIVFYESRATSEVSTTP